MKRNLLRMVLLVYAAGTAGCAATALPAGYGDALAMIVEKVADQGMLERWSSDAAAHVINPGVETSISITTSATVRLVGMDGQIELDTGGGGTKLAPGLREALIAQLDGPLSDEQRAAIIRMLWGAGGTSPPVSDP